MVQAVLPRRGTCSADGEERQAGHRQCIDDGCRLRAVRHESLWLEQGGHQPAEQNVGG